jgi:hypothetical protein
LRTFRAVARLDPDSTDSFRRRAGQAGNAERNNPGYSEAPSTITPGSVDDATLKQTAKAYIKVKHIEQTAQQVLTSSSDDTKKQQIAAQVESEKVAAVRSEGLQPEEYNQVLQLAQADKSFQQKFLSYVKAVKNSPSEAD